MTQAETNRYLVFNTHADHLKVLEACADNDVQLRCLLGAYKGVRETSYMIALNDYMQHFDVFSQFLVGQESVMVLVPDLTGVHFATVGFQFATDGYGFADFLVTGVDMPLDIVDEETVKTLDGYTYDPLHGMYLSIV